MVGRQVGSYILEDELGRGGFGVVYRAHHVSMDRRAAVKCLHPHLVQSVEMRERLLEEYRVLDRLSHANIVTLYDVHQEGDQVWLIMEYIDGPTLSELASAPMALDAVVELGQQLLSALAVAHVNEIIHRDIKPDNIKLTESGAKLLDFGLARSTVKPGLTAPGLLVGSPIYLAPELWRGRAHSPASDVYAMGLTLFQMIAGQVPFSTDRDPMSYALVHTSGEIPDVRELRPDTPPWLAHVVYRATRLDPAERFSNAKEMLRVFREHITLSEELSPRALQRLLTGEATAEPLPDAPAHAPSQVETFEIATEMPSARRRSWLPVAGVAVLALSVVGLMGVACAALGWLLLLR